MDGWVTIGTKVDNKQLEKDLKDAERRLQQFEKEAEKLAKIKSEYEPNVQGYEEEKRKLDELISKSEEYKNQIKELNIQRKSAIEAGTMIVGDTNYQKNKSEIKEIQTLQQQINREILEQQEKIASSTNEYQKQKEKLDEVNNKLEENAHNQALVRGEIQKTTAELQKTTAYDNVKKKIDGIGNSISGVVKKVGRWALAVFGIRSAYMFVRQAMSTLSQYNEQIASDVEYIRFALATALQPVIEFIIQLAYKLLGILGYIFKALFGIDIFANSSAKAFEKSKKSLAGASKSAKEINKQLASFDEMNILQDTDTSAGGGGGGGFTAPSFDLSNFEMPDLTIIYSWTDKLKEIFNDTFDKIKENIIKVMKELGFSDEFIKSWEIAIEGVRKIINGLFDFIGGLLEFFVGLVTGDTDKVKEGIKKMATGIWEIISGLVQTIIGVFAMILSVLYVSLIKPIIEVVKDMIKKVGNFFKGLWDGIVNGVKTAFNGIKNVFNGIVNFFKGIINTIIGFFKNIGATAGSVIASSFKSVVNGVLRAIETILNSPIRAINKLVGVINKVPGINLGKLSTFSLPRLAKGGIVNMPSRGIPVGNAIAGERGAEGVIPLTDSQQMALLGEAIGKYITVNATIPVYAYNRQVDRQMRIIQANKEFATNGR